MARTRAKFDRAAPWVEPYKASYNPLSILKPDSPTLVEDSGLISDALVIAGGNDPHWDDSARNLIEGIVLHVATYPGYEGRRNLVTVRRLLMNGATVTLGDQEADGMNGLQVEMLHNVELLANDGANTLLNTGGEADCVGGALQGLIQSAFNP